MPEDEDNKKKPRECKASDFGISELEYKIICDQIARRKECREVFLKARTDPCLHSKEAGFVFDPAIQKFLSMKDTQVERFQFSLPTIRFGVCAILLPMFGLGYLMWTHRTNREWQYRCGVIKYRDRSWKLR